MQNETTEFYPASKPWVESQAGVRLAGGKCSECAAVCFPMATICATCGGDAMQEHLTGTFGNLYSYTVVHTGPRQFNPPYAVGYVDMEDGLRLFGQIETPVSELSLDARLDLAIGEVSKGANGLAVVSYKFRKGGAQ